MNPASAAEEKPRAFAGIREKPVHKPTLKEFKLNLPIAAMDLLATRKLLRGVTLTEQVVEALEDYLKKPRGTFARYIGDPRWKPTEEERAARRTREQVLTEKVEGLTLRLKLYEERDGNEFAALKTITGERDALKAEVEKLRAGIEMRDAMRPGFPADLDHETRVAIARHRLSIQKLMDKDRARRVKAEERMRARAAKLERMAQRAEERERRKVERAARPRAPRATKPRDPTLTKSTGKPRVVPCGKCGTPFDRMEGREDKPGRPPSSCRSCRGL